MAERSKEILLRFSIFLRGCGVLMIRNIAKKSSLCYCCSLIALLKEIALCSTCTNENRTMFWLLSSCLQDVCQYCVSLAVVCNSYSCVEDIQRWLRLPEGINWFTAGIAAFDLSRYVNLFYSRMIETLSMLRLCRMQRCWSLPHLLRGRMICAFAVCPCMLIGET